MEFNIETFKELQEYGLKIKKEVELIISELQDTGEYSRFNCLSRFYCYDVSLNISLLDNEISFIVNIANAQDSDLSNFIIDKLLKKLEPPYSIICRTEW